MKKWWQYRGDPYEIIGPQPQTPTHSYVCEAFEGWVEERTRRAQHEAEQAVARLNREYFQPFDRLLERKAEYALKVEAEKGEIPPYLLREIETLEKFRGYVSILEDFRDEEVMTEFILLRREIEALTRDYLTFRQLYESEHRYAMLFADSLFNRKWLQNPQP